LKDPLVGPLAAIAGGVVVARFVSFSNIELTWTIGAFLLLGVVAAVRHARILAGACASIGLFFTGALVWNVHAPGPPPVLDAEGREVVILGGCVVEPPAVSGERERFLLELEPHARAQVTLYTKTADESLPPLRYGQKIELDARVRKPRNYANPGAFDYETFLARQDIYWTASGAASSVRILPGTCGSRFQKFVMDLRKSSLDRIAALYRGDDYRTSMMQAILLGQNYQLQRIWTEEYRNTGTFHTLVISGTHVAILAAFFLFLLRICFVPEEVALPLTVASAWLYALVAGWGAPCVRSAAGLTLFTIGRYFYRQRRPLNLLAAVALGFLLLDPGQLFDASFQLTFLAVAFLGAFATPLVQATSGPRSRALAGLEDTDRDLHLEPRIAQFRVEMRLLAETVSRVFRPSKGIARILVTAPARLILFLFEITMISAVIQIGLALPMVVYFHRLGVSGLSANALVVPVMGVAVPVGFVAVFTGWAWVARLGGWLLSISHAIVGWHASIEPHLRIPTPPVWLGVAFSAALIFAALARGTWWRSAAAVSVAVLLALLIWQPFPPNRHPRELEMATIDVGQGDSILVVFPDGKRMLMDAGGFPNFGHVSHTQLDPGEDVVAPYLWERGFRNLDVVVLSHSHEDHIGGLPAIVDDFHPRELWTGATPDDPLWQKLQSAAGANHTRITPLRAPDHFSYGGAEIEVLAPLPDYVPEDKPKNNDSLVLRIRYGKHSFLLCGDVERPIERRMLAENEIQLADVLKVAHHGSHTSSTEEFISAAGPLFAVISVGFENSYGHPHRDILSRLADHGATVYRTDINGLISIRTDGQRFTIESR
jgi:competence protein ComEC